MMAMHSGENTLKIIVCSAVVSLFVMGLAHAAVIVKIVEIDVPDHIFGSDVIAYDILASSQEELRAVSLHVSLNDGGVIHNIDPANLGGNKRPLDALVAVPTFQDLKYDTYVDLPISRNGGSLDDVIILGRAQGDLKDFDSNDPNFESDPAMLGPNRLSASWGSTTFVDSPIVDYPIARVTVGGRGSVASLTDLGFEVEVVAFVADDDPNNTSGQMAMHFGGNLAAGELSQATGIPEPATLVMFGLGSVLMWPRRRVA